MSRLQKVDKWLKVWLQWFVATSLAHGIGIGLFIGCSIIGSFGTSLLEHYFRLDSYIVEQPADGAFVSRFLQSVLLNTGLAVITGFAQYLVLRPYIKNASSWAITYTAFGAIGSAIAMVYQPDNSFNWLWLISNIIFQGLQAISISRQRRWIVYWITAGIATFLVGNWVVTLLQPYSNRLTDFVSTLTPAQDTQTLIYAFLLYLVSVFLGAILPIIVSCGFSGAAVAQFLTEIEQTSPHLSKHPV